MSRPPLAVPLRRTRLSAIASLALLSLVLLPAGAEQMVRIPGNRSTRPLTSRFLGPAAPEARVPLAVALPLRNTGELEDLLRRLYTPGNPDYGRFLTPEQFTERFGPTRQDYEAVTAYCRERGFRITATYPNRALLSVEAPARAVESAFQVRLQRFQSAEGLLFQAPDLAPAVPESLSGKILGIIGLDTSRVEHAAMEHRPSESAPPETGESVGTGQLGYLSPSDVQKAYNVDTVPEDGGGQVLAIVGYDGYSHSDIATFNSAYFPGRPAVPLEDVMIDGATGTPGASTQGEVTADIEMQIAMAPGASKILVYLAPSNHPTGSIDTYTRIATDNRAKLVSTSWSAKEDPTYWSVFHAENNAFLQMAAQGQSMFAAAGNRGAYYDVNNPTVLQVGDRASQPYVTGVGGTKLTTSGPGGPWLSETSWNDPTTTPKRGGGGGISSLWGIPWYQVGVITPASLGSTTKRNVPDVSLNATLEVFYSTYIKGNWGGTAGTSLATPLWSGFMARVNQRRTASGRGPIGFANPALYRILNTPRYAVDFHDIADGSNNLYYPAITGYDLSTGLGTLNGANLIVDLASATSAAPGLVFTRQPGRARTGQPLSVQPIVTVLADAGQTAAAYAGPVTISIKPGTGAAGAALGGTTTVNAVAGVATFTNLSIDRDGTGYVLRVSAVGMAADSQPFDIATPKPVFTTQPGYGTPGQPLTRQPVVTFQAFGETATDITLPITVAIKPGTGSAGAVLSGTKSVNAVTGVAAFTDLSINWDGANYVLTATGNGITAESAPFSVLPSRVYVSKTGNNGNAGTAWASAKATVGAGLAAVAPGGEVWVAKGAYAERITLPAGIALYGGFVDSETSLSLREISANPTILDGGEAGPVVTIASGANRDTVLDGFTIRNGRNSAPLGGTARGGGISCTNTAPTIRNNTITANTATLGGGLFISGGAPLVIYNMITDNVAAATERSIGAGGGVFIAEGSEAMLVDNVIAGNAATGLNLLGGIYSQAGGIFCAESRVVFRNNTVCSNLGVYKFDTHGTVNTTGGIVLYDTRAALLNNIAAFNRGANLEVVGTSPELLNNDFYTAGGGLAYLGNIIGIPNPAGTHGNIEQNPVFLLTTAGDYRLCAGSPCIDAGNSSELLPRELDFAGHRRWLGDEVDMGAFESAVQPAFTATDVRRALAIAAGLQGAMVDDQLRLNITSGRSAAASIDLNDALCLCRKMAGLDPNP